MMPKFCLYLAISNIWIIYRSIFKKQYSNDISKYGPIKFFFRYLLTIFIGMPAFYLLIIISFLTGIFMGRSITIGREAKKLMESREKDSIRVIYLLFNIKIILRIMYFNKYIIKFLSFIRKKLIV